MSDYVEQLDNILRATGEEVLTHAGKISHAQAMEKAKAECKRYQAQTLSPVEEEYLKTIKQLDTVDNSQINVLTQRTMHRICTAATNEEVSFAYRVAIPRQRFRWRNAFSTRWRSL